MSEGEADGSGQADLLDEYRTSPMKFPLHVLDEYGEPLCGRLSEGQEQYLGKKGYTHLPTVAEKRADEPWETFLGSLCGNCRRSLLTMIDDEDVHTAWENRQEAMRRV